MHLLVLSAFQLEEKPFQSTSLNTVSMHLLVLSAFQLNAEGYALTKATVSMHLLVLSAFQRRPVLRPSLSGRFQCTFWCSVLSNRTASTATMIADVRRVSMHLLVLSAFQPMGRRPRSRMDRTVSMHLLVLSAFQLRPQKTAPQGRLPERNRRRPGKHHIESARTCPIKPHNREIPPQTTPAPPTPPTH